MARDDSPSLPDADSGGLCYRFADVEFDTGEGVLRVDGRVVDVEPRPLRLLAELLRQAGEVLTKEELFETVWDGRPTVDHVLANAVSKLRAALGRQGAACILTVPRVGYRLQAAVQCLPSRAPEPVLRAGHAVPGRDGYVLDRALGQAGHHDVWLAHHAKLGQARVFKFAADGARLAGLKREFTLYRLLRQELGPRADFATVVDTNFATPPYFLECEYGGLSLLEWAQARPHLAAMPMAERVGLMVQIAQAVAAAHGVGVLHKDLKPGNVLIDGEPGRWQARLTDFGSGRLIDAARLSALQVTALGLTENPLTAAGAGSPSGTVLYLAPELVAGHEPSVQSDVYALGLMLYQLLVGDLRRPLSTGWERDVGDELLVADIAAATEGQPQRRLKSVAALLERLRSLPERRQALERERDEQARSEQAAQARQRSRARRPWVIGTLASLALGLTASLRFGWQARGALERAQEQSARADAINEFIGEDLLGSINIAGVGPDGMVPMREMLEHASELAGERFRGRPQIEAMVRGQIARLFFLLALFDQAEAEGRRALALAGPAALASDPVLMRVRFELVRSLAVHDKLQEAKELLELAEREAGAERLSAEGPLAMSAAMARANVLISSGQAQAAIEPMKRVIALSDGLARDRHHARFTSRVMMGDVLFRVGRLDEAEALLAEVLAPPYEAGNVGAVNLARAQIIQARVQTGLGRPEVAEPMLEAARQVLLSRLGPGEHYVAVASLELGKLYEQRGDFERSLAAYRAGRDGLLSRFGEGHPAPRVLRLNVAIVEMNLGRAAAALSALNDERAWFVKYLGGDKGPVVQSIDFNRARALTALDDAPQALSLLGTLDAAVLTEGAPARDWVWRLQAETGRALLHTGRRDEGRGLLQAALPPMRELGTPAWLMQEYQRLLLQAGA